jgi:transglutaminase-like putative cysteine protease
MIRALLLSSVLLWAGAQASLAQAPSAAPQADASPSIEVVKRDVDIEAAPDGQFWETIETRYRPLDSLGVQALQQMTLSYTAGYQLLRIHAYTLKKDGHRLDVPENSILQGHGATTTPGFEDTRNMTVVFPNMEVGDQAVILANTTQLVPWFPDVFANTEQFSRTIVVKEARVAFTSRGNDAAYHITASGLDADPPASLAGKTRHVWHFRNDTPERPEAGAVTEVGNYPSVQITSLGSYADVGRIYAEIFRDKSAVTPEISKLSETLTADIRDRHAQAKALYDWVAAHIQYVNIVLGAGGFQPHEAKDVLKNGYGDCKDHVMLLQALLAARGIKSSAVLIRAASNEFRLPTAPSPFLFDHLISYIPEFQLYLDSTARYAPFGVLPSSDAGKEVVIVASGKIAITPPVLAANAAITSETVLVVNKDGSADGDSKIVASGADAVDMRGGMASLPSDRDAEYFRALLGPGSDGKFQRGNPENLNGNYEYSAHYHQALLANFSGPGALPAALSYKPFSFSQLIGLGLPNTRSRDYVCASGIYQENVTVTLPPGVAVTALPLAKTFSTDGVELRTDYQQVKPDTVRAKVYLKLDRAGPVCKAADYARIRPALSEMVGALLSQILYR